MFKTKHNFLSIRAGFTLVELTVVMTIIGILSLIGIPSLLAARDTAILDSRVEEFLTTVREAQNNAIAIKKISEDETRGWGIWLTATGTSYNLESFYAQKDVITGVPVKNDVAPRVAKTFGELGPVTYTVSSSSGSVTTPLFIGFTSPFGTAHIISAPEFSHACMNKTGSPCWWQESTNPSKEWIVIGSPTYYINRSLNNTDKARITFNHKGRTKSVVIESNGDAYIE